MPRLLRAVACLLCLAPLAAAASVVDDATPGAWVDASGDLFSGEAAGANIWRMAAWPGSGMIVASMTKKGLWASADGGATWKRLGEPGKRPPDSGQAVQYVFDPKAPERMWCSGMYGFGCWRTDDGGKSFVKLGDNNHLDGMAVDFSDPARRTLLQGWHEQDRSLRLSTDGGNSWTKIGDKLPDGTGFSTLPIIIDSKNFIVNTSGWGKKSWGIWSSADAGQTWKKVSEAGPMDYALVTRKGTMFWSLLWNADHIVSRDGGQTWSKLGAPVRGLIIELPDGTLVGLGGAKQSQPYASSDDGATWKPFGQEAPFKPVGIIYEAKRGAFFCYREKSPQPPLIVRWDLKDKAAK